MPDPIPSWEDWLRWALCELYKKLGGDCADLDQDPNKRVAEVAEYHATNGPPQLNTPQEKAAFLAQLSAIESHLKKPENSLDAEHNAQLYGLIDSLRKDV